MNESERRSVVGEVGGWVWGTIEGGFNEQQTISQIIVDAAIGMIPVVGDVTAVRDLIATILRLVERPEKRKEKLEWITLVLLLFALVPVAGGAIKGVGKLLMKGAGEAGEHAALLRKLVAVLNRLGEGDAVKFIKALDFEKHTGEILAKWRGVVERLDKVLGAALKHFRARIPEAMARRLEAIRSGVRELAEVGERMIPESLKELNLRLRAVQRHLYAGEWHEIPRDVRSARTLEPEARLVETMAEADRLGQQAAHPHFPPNSADDYFPVKDFPDLRLAKPTTIPSFSGPIRPVFLPEGTVIHRVIGARSNTAGEYWLYHLPASGHEWREDFAVLENFSENGFRVELRVPEGGLYAWEGTVASQFQNDLGKASAGQYLKGGGTQIFVDFNFPANAAAKEKASKLNRAPTGWTDVMGVNVPSKDVAAELLGEHERASKAALVASGAQAASRRKKAPPEERTAP